MPRSGPLYFPSPAVRRPPLDDQLRRRTIEMHKHHLCDVSDEHFTRRCTFTRDHSFGNRSTSDLRLTWPRPLVVLDWIDGRTVKGKALVPVKVCEFSRGRHRTECQTAVSERALDSRDPRRAVGSNGRDRLVSMSVEQTLDDTCHLRFGTFEIAPRRHEGERIAATPGQLPQGAPVHICLLFLIRNEVEPRHMCSRAQ